MSLRLLLAIASCVAVAVAVAPPAVAAPKTQANPPAANGSAKASPAPAPQQGNNGPPNAVQGFSQNQGKPVHIEAMRMEVRDKDKVATFFGNVQVNQGDTEMHCKTLVVYYEQDEGTPSGSTAGTATAEVPGPGGQQRIKKLDARGSVVITQNDQVATGDSALFDMQTNIVTLVGNVVVTQGPSVMRGERMVVNMTTGFSRLESGKGSQGRVQGLFLPGNGNPLPGAVNPPGGANANNARPPAATAPAPAATQLER